MSPVRFLSLCVLLGGIAVVLGGGGGTGGGTGEGEGERSDLMKETAQQRLECLRKDLIREGRQADDLQELGQSRSLTDLLEGLNRETDEQKKSNTDDKAKNAVGGDDDEDDDDDNDDADEIDGSDVCDGIFYVAANLVDEIEATCDLKIKAIFNGFLPATLAQVNDASTKLSAATKELDSVLASAPGFADNLKTFADSSTFKAADVAANIDKTFAQIDKTLTTVEKKVFCANAAWIAARLQMSLYGGVGFANGYLCNKVFVELVRYHLNATKVLEATTTEEDFVKNCTKNLVEDITCYEKELEAYNKILPTAAFTASSPLQTAAFTADFLIDYGVVLMYHRLVLVLEAEVVKLCAAAKDSDKDKDVDRKKEDVDSLKKDTESLTDQLQKLLKKLNEVSSKKKEAQLALIGRTGAKTLVGNESPENEDTKPVMPSVGDKTAIKKSFYRERED